MARTSRPFINLGNLPVAETTPTAEYRAPEIASDCPAETDARGWLANLNRKFTFEAYDQLSTQITATAFCEDPVVIIEGICHPEPTPSVLHAWGHTVLNAAYAEYEERTREHEWLVRTGIDPETGLANKEGVQRWLQKNYGIDANPPEGKPERRRHRPLFEIEFDGFNFKKLNDLCGRRIGDELLRTIAQKIKDSVRDAFHSRYTGDEFHVLIADLSPENAQRILKRLQAAELARIPAYDAAWQNIHTIRASIDPDTKPYCEVRDIEQDGSSAKILFINGEYAAPLSDLAVTSVGAAYSLIEPATAHDTLAELMSEVEATRRVHKKQLLAIATEGAYR